MIRYIDLFCGIGGFRIGATQALEKLGIASQCVFSSDIDHYARQAYHSNFGDFPVGDITKVQADDVPEHDLLLAGFPCQPFSIIGQSKGFDDTRGTLFFDIARLLKAKRPLAFILENVKQLAGHNQGKTLQTILNTLGELGYHVDYRVLNALDYGLPQKRERIFIVGFQQPTLFQWPHKHPRYKPLTDILERNVASKFYASEMIRNKRLSKHHPTETPSIWHENKSGHISSYPFSCALRAGASHNYLLVNGKRRLTPREMLRLQGFPDSFKISVSDCQTRKQAGNSVAVNIVRLLVESLLSHLETDTERTSSIG